jgi:hypothetical protein
LGTSIVGAGTAASPYSLVTNIRQSNAAPGGLVVSGPGRGLQFRSDGSLAPFDPGVPTATTNFSIGGDGGIEHNEYLLPAFSTGQAFVHYDHDLGSLGTAPTSTVLASAPTAPARSTPSPSIATMPS